MQSPPHSSYSTWGANDDQSSFTSPASATRGSPSIPQSQLDGVEGFNDEFQRLLLQLSDDRILKDEAIYKQLFRIAVDFKTAAQAYGLIIIAEKHLPYERKTLKPVAIGGIGGGDKYLAAGILFKFAMDSRGLYGGDDYAAKVAGHELRGLKEVVKCGLEGLLWPLTAVLDHLGSRLVCVSFLDAINRDGNDTLVAGTMDAGQTMRYPTGDVLRVLSSLCDKLHLRPHRVAFGAGGPDDLAYGPADLEVHLVDHRLMAVDFARLMPHDCTPLPAGSACANPVATRQLRPELVRTGAPLSSDACSGFAAPECVMRARRTVTERSR